jgi:hypothetical protein
MARLQDGFRVRGFERRIMRLNRPGRIARGLDELRRHRIAGKPHLHGLIVDREGQT